MAYSTHYENTEPSRADVDAHESPLVIEFGTPYCGYCRAAQPHIAKAMAGHPEVRHIKIEDGPGRRLGRSFRVKRWPTLVFLANGEEAARLVRPTDAAPIAEALARIARQ